jgi:hypothetical protein
MGVQRRSASRPREEYRNGRLLSRPTPDGHNDVEMVLAEYKGGPLNAGYFAPRWGSFDRNQRLRSSGARCPSASRESSETRNGGHCSRRRIGALSRSLRAGAAALGRAAKWQELTRIPEQRMGPARGPPRSERPVEVLPEASCAIGQDTRHVARRSPQRFRRSAGMAPELLSIRRRLENLRTKRRP